MRLFAFALFVAISCGCAQEYSLGPDSQPHDGSPKGTVTKSQLEPGKYYPGTPHTYWVYVPAQYDASKPTPFMIYMDGSGPVGNGQRVPVVFDNLIARHELPPMIGIFIDPGVLPAVSDAAQNRYERIFEYDSLSDRFANFLIGEVIPEVAKKYNLSKDPNDRGLAGTSTGAVAAFMAAWNRPDQFRRVISLIGTFVSMKGADAMPAFIRKTEPKPLRIFMQDGKKDHIVPAEPYGTFYAGSWPINNQVMFEALEYSGYDAKLEMGEGGHSGQQGASIMPDILRWLWRDYPQPIAVHEPAAMSQPGWDPRGKVFSIVSAGKTWEPVGGAYGFVASPTADRDGNIYFADPTAHRIYRARPDGKVEVFREGAGGAAAIAAAADGRIYAAQPTRRRIAAYDAAGSVEKTIVQNVDVAGLAATAKGALYFTDPIRKTVGYVAPDGRQRVVYSGGEIASPTGLALSADQAMLIVTDAQSRFSWSFQIAPDGGLINGEPFYRLEMPETGWMSGVTGAMEDASGQVYFATPLGIQMCEANGRVAAILNAPGSGGVNAIAFSGDWLYAAQGGGLFRRAVKVKGAEVWNPLKPPKPPL
jgi:enterochelin esterase-like enzyme/sugar lactone lactonase YvrE